MDDKVAIHRKGSRVVVEPVRRKNLVEVLADLEPLSSEDQFPDVDETLLLSKGIDL